MNDAEQRVIVISSNLARWHRKSLDALLLASIAWRNRIETSHISRPRGLAIYVRESYHFYDALTLSRRIPSKTV